MKNPYKVLGVNENATDEEIKEAYKALAKKYHPDKFADSDLAEIASEKMKEINSAYDEIQKQRSGKGESGHDSNYYNPNENSNSEYYAKIRKFINQGAIFEAEKMLSSVSPAERNAEWNFLMACVLIRKGLYADASAFLDNACNMDPSNQEYKSAKDFINNRGQSFGNAYRTGTSVSACDCCQSLICADCCCECMGGDLIRCC